MCMCCFEGKVTVENLRQNDWRENKLLYCQERKRDKEANGEKERSDSLLFNICFIVYALVWQIFSNPI